MSEEVAEIFSKHIFSSKYEDLSENTIKQLLKNVKNQFLAVLRPIQGVPNRKKFENKFSKLI